MPPRIRALVPVALLLTATGCHFPINLLGPFQGIKGSGNIVEEAREVPEFHAFQVGGAMHATVGYAETPSLKLRADDNILPLIKTEVRDGRLVVWVDSKGGVSSSKPIEVVALTPKLEAVAAHGASMIQAAATPGEKFRAEASGASEVSVRDIDAGALDAEASGASTLTVIGQAKTVNVSSSGASTVEATQLAAESVRLDVSGSSRAEVRASDSARGSASGASDVTVEGAPGDRGVETSGASHVSYLPAEQGGQAPTQPR